ncbi:MAG: CopD family protein [Bacteroidota bacterium]|nr:CopD family protein [Bacteroidota bacterium]
MAFLYIKALHVIFIVTWFAGLFYIVRLFIYQTEANVKPEPERTILIKQYKLMSRRLWLGISWPSAIATFIFGLVLLHYFAPDIPFYLWIKLGFVAGLYIYFFICHFIFRMLQKDVYKYSSQSLRIWNEVATIFLISIVFLIILKNTLSMIYGLIGLLIFSVVLVVSIQIYKKVRKE